MRTGLLLRLTFVFGVTVLNSGRLWAGGSCQDSSECEDGNDCTADSCVLNSCRHDPVAVNTPCGDSSDTVCTDPDRCGPGGVCLRNDAANGTACTALSVCITGESCDSGFCVGTYTTNCCTTPADCDDRNPCTNDTCVANACQHTNTAPGTPCGSSVDDNCTNPDTCNAAGQCQTNDTNDGADCGGPDCLGGVCGEDTYRATLLPEGNNIGSETRGGAAFDGDPDRPIIVGRVIDGGSVDHAAAWSCGANGTNCTLTELPEGVAVTSVANGVACGPGICVAVGSKGSPAQPAAWVYDGVTWAAESVPLPPDNNGNALPFTVIFEFETPTVVGSSENAQGFGRATYWERSVQGVWSVFVLPDFLVPGRDSAATDVEVCPAGAAAVLCVEGARLITGAAEDGSGIVHPVIWRESGEQSGSFEMAVLPLPAGASNFFPTPTFVLRTAYFGGDDAGLYTSGTIVMGDSKSRGVVWRTTDFQSWVSTVLAPLAGFTNSYTIGMAFSNCVPGQPPMFYRVKGRGASYPPGGNPLLDGVATQWALDETTLALTSGPTDMNALVTGIPTAYDVGSISSSKGGDEPLYGSIVFPRPASYKFKMSDVYPSAVAGTPQPHAVIVIAGPPAGIPAASTWSLAVMGLLLITAATLAVQRRRCTE